MKVTLETLKKIEGLGFEGEAVARAFYQKIFDHVADKKDWKGPISIKVPLRWMEEYEEEVVRHAIIYFTGNPDVKITRLAMSEGLGDMYRIKSAGYRAGPCGG